MADRLTAEQCHAIFEELGYHRPTSDPLEPTYVSEGKVAGPKGLFHVMPDDMLADSELFHEWLCDHVGIDSAAVDAAFRAIAGEVPRR